jgi:hypothetical protein
LLSATISQDIAGTVAAYIERYVGRRGGPGMHITLNPGDFRDGQERTPTVDWPEMRRGFPYRTMWMAFWVPRELN